MLLQRELKSAQYFNISIFQSFNISISIFSPRRMRVPASVEKTARGTAAMVTWPSEL